MTLREQAASSLHVYKCITRTQFLNPRVPSIPLFQAQFRKDSRNSQDPSQQQQDGDEAKKELHDCRVLEIGSCFGTEVRGLIRLGVPASHVVATDVVDGYWRLGTQLYGDAPSGVETHFTDMAVPAPAELESAITALFGTRDLVIASQSDSCPKLLLLLSSSLYSASIFRR